MPAAASALHERSGDHADLAMPELDEMTRDQPARLALARHDLVALEVERDGVHRRDRRAVRLERVRELHVLGHRRDDDEAIDRRAPDEAHHVFDELRRPVIDGMHQELVTELGAFDEDAALHVIGDLGVRIVVHEPEHEGAVAGQRAGTEVGYEVEAADDLLHSRAGLRIHFRRLIEHARRGAYRDAGRMGYVVDRDRRSALGPQMSVMFHVSPPPAALR
jgi:hypothetical protein